MKPTDTIEFLRGALWMLCALVCAFVLWAVTSPARAQMPEGVEQAPLSIDCGDFLCVMPKGELDAVLSANKKMAKALKDKEKEAPKCGTLEVVPKQEPKGKAPPQFQGRP